MNDLEYNSYIQNYMDNDKTQSAIMLIAPWGMGKSYYIVNSLIPYIEKAGDKRCVVISLYGMNDIKEISRAIYLEMRTKAISFHGEKYEAGKIFGKTIVKGVLSKVGIDLSLDEEDLNKLYASIDLTDKLIIFEDLERSGINIKQVLGYVNNLVEQDGAKVLLVANENEIKHYKKLVSKEKDGKEVSKWVYDEETEEYLKIKEKTVSDTILYLCDYDNAIENILNMFSDNNLIRCLDEKNDKGKSIVVCEIQEIMQELKDYNLRSLIFACQKTVDIFANYRGTLNIEFFRYVFLGNVAFAIRLKKNGDILWDDKTNPNDLGTSKYPLHEFCYNYFKYQDLDVSKIKYYQEVFLEKEEYENKQRESNSALSILYDFHLQSSIMLYLAIETIREDLQERTVIPLSTYGKLANYLIAVKYVLDNVSIIDECKAIIINNLKNADPTNGELLERLRMHDSFSFWREEQSREYNAFIEEMSIALQSNTFSISENEDSVEYLSKISKIMCDTNNSFRQTKSFMERVDIDRIVEGLEKATAKQVSEFRRGILSIYRSINVRDSLPNDKNALVSLRDRVLSLIDNGKGRDKIIQLQYSWLVSNIETGINNYQ